MRYRYILCFMMTLAATLFATAGFPDDPQSRETVKIRGIVAADTILSGIIFTLLPPERYVVEAILPSGQCPGHFDVKLSDVEKVNRADLFVCFQETPFTKMTGPGGGQRELFVDSENRNWMVPDAYLRGLMSLAEKLSERFSEERDTIQSRRDAAIREVKKETASLLHLIVKDGLSGKPVIASSMQKEPLEWMGFRVVGEFGRAEAISARDLVRLSKTGKKQKIVAVVDNLQSGPEAGKGIAETLGIPHVILTNFPSEHGYLATLAENVNALRNALKR